MADPTPLADTEANRRAIELHNRLWNDTGPKGQSYRAAVKENYPDARIPEDTAEIALAPMREQLEAANVRMKAMEEKAADREAKEAERELQGDMNSRLDATRIKYRLDGEAFDKMVSRMKDTNNYGDSDAAALWVMSQNPAPATERGPEPVWLDRKLNLFGSAQHDDRMAKLHNDPMGFMDDGLRDFAQDPAAYVAEDQRLLPLGQI